MRDIFLTYPLEGLAIWDFFEIFSHSSIELTERDDPFMAIISGEIFYDLFEYYLRSLTPTDYEDMRFGGFPFETLFVKRGRGDFALFPRRNPPPFRHLLYKGGLEYRIEYLAYHFSFFHIKVLFRTLKSEKYTSREKSEDAIRSPRYSIRLMEVEGNS
jgi:hypothetical protein